jgi:hypothetical protein
MPEHNYEQQLRYILGTNAWFMALLRTVRTCNLPDWFVGAGVIRNITWDYLHSYTEPTPVADVDVAFFDPADLTPERDKLAQQQLQARQPEIPWEATNQAAVHLWYETVFGCAVSPLTSTLDAIGTWPETVTCIGVRLLPDDTLLVAAPYGLADLFNLVLRWNPRRVSLEQFQKRVREKKILEKWPKVRLVHESEEKGKCNNELSV